MQGELRFRIALGIVFAALLVVRVYYQIQARRAGAVTEFEGKANIAARIVAGLGSFALLVLYLVNPAALAWASVALPSWLRWAGLPIGVLGIVLLLWVHLELGANFRGTLHLREGHTLITSGPYRWVRHPMYTAFFAITLSFTLLSVNWLIGTIFTGVLVFVMITRVKREEEVMRERFGVEYQTWELRTGRFLPRLRAQD